MQHIFYHSQIRYLVFPLSPFSANSANLFFFLSRSSRHGTDGGRDEYEPELKTSRAILWTPPRWLATEVSLITMFQPVMQAMVNVNVQKMTAGSYQCTDPRTRSPKSNLCREPHLPTQSFKEKRRGEIE
jgi:hypothetical protein